MSGTVHWLNMDDSGREYLQGVIRSGDCFGELPLFDNQPFAASALATEDCVVIRLRKQTFLDLLREDQDLHFRFNKMMVERLRFKFLLHKTLSIHSPEERILSFFSYLKEAKRYICPQCHRINLTRQQIADLCGLRVETVIRVTRKMHEVGQLLIKDRKIYYA
jgi:CRP-like cAMP-binding protein